MKNNKFDFLESKIDSDRFGFKVAKINSKEFLNFEVFNELKNNDFKLVISRIPGEDIPTINFLEKNGFSVKDVQLTYKFDLIKSKINYEYFNKDLNIREANFHDIESLKNIASESFWEYGHYFADEKLNKLDCIAIYKDWTERAVLDKKIAQKVFVAEFQSKVIGYLFFSRNENHLFSAGCLGAVAKEGRGQNVFSTLAIHGLEWAKSEGHIWQEHNVLNINYPVNRVFSKIGMSIFKSELTFHNWI
jgi:hypothetical protein